MSAPEPKRTARWSILLREPMRLRQEAFWLVVVSLLDLFMTYDLLRRGGPFYESNPVAQLWFERWNMAGMTAFKFLVFGSVIALSEVVERHRPGRGRLILRFGILLTAAVVIYSVRLALTHPG